MTRTRCAALAVPLWLAAATAGAQSFEADVAPLVQTSCVRCHGARTVTPLNLDSLGFDLADHDTFSLRTAGAGRDATGARAPARPGAG